MSIDTELETDGAVSARHALERYGFAAGSELPSTDLVWQTVWVSAHRGAPYSERRFLVHRSALSLEPTQLRHLAGTAVLRQMLEASTDDWENLSRRVGDITEPDARWYTPQGVVAVEFDVGGYSPRQVGFKRALFDVRFRSHIWGTVTAIRARRLEAALAGSKARPEVMVVPWM